MADWFVARSGQQRGPFSSEELRERIGRGDVAPSDLAWREGMPQWVAAGLVPELAGLFPAAPQPQPVAYAQPFSRGGTTVVTDRAIDMLRQTAPWARLFGVLIFIGGIIGLITGAVMFIGGIGTAAEHHSSAAAAVGVLIAIGGVISAGVSLLYFFPGLYLNRYASRINLLVSTRREDALEQALEAQKSFWKFMGVLFLVSIGLWLLMVVMSFAFGAASTTTITNTAYTPVPTTPVQP